MSTITGRGLNRRSLLAATGAAAIGMTFTACGEKPKASGAGGKEFDDVDIKELDWVEGDRKVKAIIIYETSL